MCVGAGEGSGEEEAERRRMPKFIDLISLGLGGCSLPLCVERRGAKGSGLVMLKWAMSKKGDGAKASRIATSRSGFLPIPFFSLTGHTC